MRVAVIGAGVVGAAVAAGLTRLGARVTILEERFPGAGTSGTSFAWVNAAKSGPESYFTLNHAAVHAHHALPGSPFAATGHLAWASDETYAAELAARVAELRDLGYAVERLTAARAATLEPDIAAQPDGTEYAFFPEEGHVLPIRLLARFLAEARTGGARLEIGAAVRHITVGPGVVTLTLADGGVRVTDRVVCCAGRWTPLLLRVPLLDPRVSGSVTNGFLVSTTAMPARLSRVLTTDRLNVRPEGGGRLMLQAADMDDAADPDVAPGSGIGAELLSRLPTVLTGTVGADVEQTRVGQRVMPPDGLTIAGFTDPGERVYVVATHSGITLAPLLADLVAGELHGSPSALLAPFRPTRFVSGEPVQAHYGRR